MGQQYNLHLKVCDDQKYAGCKLNETQNPTSTTMPPLIHNFSENEPTKQLNTTAVIPINTNQTRSETNTPVLRLHGKTENTAEVANHLTDLNSTKSGTGNNQTHINTLITNIAQTNTTITTTMKPQFQSTQFQTQNSTTKIEVTSAQDINVENITKNENSDKEESNEDDNEDAETDTSNSTIKPK
ncbi:hypothetical protein QE152_g40074 [Popillia japonica]|uniref:Uncharacterized protein n=1 Tax=Popillia japonica TaxID=7064 RepID=A0AAW1HSL2_POPJA